MKPSRGIKGSLCPSTAPVQRANRINRCPCPLGGLPLNLYPGGNTPRPTVLIDSAFRLKMSWLSAGVGAYIRSPDGGRHRGVSFRKPGKPGKILFAIIGVTSFMFCPTGTALMCHVVSRTPHTCFGRMASLSWVAERLCARRGEAYGITVVRL